MIPLARLYIRKVKNIPRNCDDQFLQSQVLDVSENTEEDASRRKLFSSFGCILFLSQFINIPLQLNVPLAITLNGLHARLLVEREFVHEPDIT